MELHHTENAELRHILQNMTVWQNSVELCRTSFLTRVQRQTPKIPINICRNLGRCDISGNVLVQAGTINLVQRVIDGVVVIEIFAAILR